MKSIVLCGSMKVLDKIYEVKEILESKGFNVILPKECIDGLPKVVASKAHFNRIIDPKNEIILVVNSTKNGIENYIGPNSFAEIAFAFYYLKKIYLLNDIYIPYKDELIGWNVIPLMGNLDMLS